MVSEAILNGRMWIWLVKFINYLFYIGNKLMTITFVFVCGFYPHKRSSCPLVFGSATFRYLESTHL